MPAESVFVAQMARLYLAVPGTVAPADPVTAMAAGWKEVGLFQPGSLEWNTEPKFEEVKSHQLQYAARTIQTEDAASLKVELQEWNSTNIVAVYGGGQVTSVTQNSKTFYRFSPPKVGGRSQFTAVVELIDGAKHYRRVIPLCEQVASVSQKFPNDKESTLPLELKVIGGAAGDPWYDLTDDPGFAPAA
ncbi:hypothetical protein LN042_18985 [Kitasatospora sp. RB6PN24]|uniref:phage tail tube protein n=1 Tax=Kitasatospora humi TaxID=2893891 RepID=UPI001E5B4E64|nr:hypothetical protein [Kitasatospora humi]MCC9309142.1 hypothetical protein [Kitasatospora humi]